MRSKAYASSWRMRNARRPESRPGSTSTERCSSPTSAAGAGESSPGTSRCGRHDGAARYGVQSGSIADASPGKERPIMTTVVVDIGNTRIKWARADARRLREKEHAVHAGAEDEALAALR